MRESYNQLTDRRIASCRPKCDFDIEDLQYLAIHAKRLKIAREAIMRAVRLTKH